MERGLNREGLKSALTVYGNGHGKHITRDVILVVPITEEKIGI